MDKKAGAKKRRTVQRLSRTGAAYEQRVKARGNGDGAPFQLADGTWRGKYRGLDGTTHYVRGKTQQEARDRLKAARDADLSGKDLAAERLTFGTFAERWLATRKNIEVTTRSKYETCLKVHVKPGLGGFKLSQLRAEHVEDWLDNLTAKRRKGPPTKLGPARQQTLLKLVRTILKAADARGYLPQGNVAQYVEMPHLAKRRREAPDPHRVARLLATLDDNPRLRAFVLLCLGGGLRRGEALGLTWGAVDLSTGRLEVRARVNRVKKELGGLIVRPGAKSEAGERVTYVADFATDALRQLRTEVIKTKLAAKAHTWLGPDDPVDSAAHVFVTKHGTLWSPEDADKSFKRACAQAGLGERQSFHGLRHDFASLLAKLGVPLKVAMEMLGHSTELMTIYYQHTSDDDRRDAAGRVDGWLRQAAGV